MKRPPLQATYTQRAEKARLVRIMRRKLKQNGIEVGIDMVLRWGHWWVHRNGFWVRTTDALSMEVLP
jgi:hypothetical protein